MFALPGNEEADIAGHSSRILEHLRPEVEPLRPEMIVPKFIASARPAFQSRVPVGIRVVDPPAVVSAQIVWESIDLHFTLTALGCLLDELHDELKQLLGGPLWRLVEFRYNRLLLFILLLLMEQFLGRFGRLAVGHAAPEIRCR